MRTVTSTKSRTGIHFTFELYQLSLSSTTTLSLVLFGKAAIRKYPSSEELDVRRSFKDGAELVFCCSQTIARGSYYGLDVAEFVYPSRKMRPLGLK